MKLGYFTFFALERKVWHNALLHNYALGQQTF